MAARVPGPFSGNSSEVGLAVCDASDPFEAGEPSIATALRAESPGLALLMVGGQPGDPALLPLMRGGPVETLPDPLDEAALSAGLDALQGKLES